MPPQLRRQTKGIAITRDTEGARHVRLAAPGLSERQTLHTRTPPDVETRISSHQQVSPRVTRAATGESSSSPSVAPLRSNSPRTPSSISTSSSSSSSNDDGHHTSEWHSPVLDAGLRGEKMFVTSRMQETGTFLGKESPNDTTTTTGGTAKGGSGGGVGGGGGAGESVAAPKGAMLDNSEAKPGGASQEGTPEHGRKEKKGSDPSKRNPSEAIRSFRKKKSKKKGSGQASGSGSGSGSSGGSGSGSGSGSGGGAAESGASSLSSSSVPTTADEAAALHLKVRALTAGPDISKVKKIQFDDQSHERTRAQSCSPNITSPRAYKKTSIYKRGGSERESKQQQVNEGDAAGSGQGEHLLSQTDSLSDYRPTELIDVEATRKESQWTKEELESMPGTPNSNSPSNTGLAAPPPPPPPRVLVLVRSQQRPEWGSDFTEIELPTEGGSRTMAELKKLLAEEFAVEPEAIQRVKKLPDIWVRTDRQTTFLLHGDRLDVSLAT